VRKNHSLHIYGPVPSRRLGYSLGIDILPFKTCSLDCVYCQLGSTRRKTVRREKFFDTETILNQINNVISSGQRIDYITFSGSGEPTLNVSVGKLIREIKKNTPIPVAVLTNSTLISRKNVRDALSHADLVIPSLDAATQKIFAWINRPHPLLKIHQIIAGLKKFRQEFRGKIWLEVLFVKGWNDSPSHIQKLKKAITEINPDRIQINTVVRPPAEKSARPLSSHELEKIRKIFGKKAEIIATFDKTRHIPSSDNIKEAILAMVARRPVTLSDLSKSLGKHKNELIKYCDILLKEDKIKLISHEGKKFFESKKQENQRILSKDKQ
jgi:wyosine [tRNA(Phe)-imidazoG37] synthetase (radical SAM superfamily)